MNSDTTTIAPAPSLGQRTLDLVASQGGFTFTLNGVEPGTGFCVGGLWSDSLVLDSSTTAAAAQARIRLWLIRNEPVLREEGVHIGGWKDSETGLIWLDFVKVFSADEREAAIAAGIEADQIAIWSLHEAEEIRTGGSGAGHCSA